jgi:hypothetical protein
MKASTRKLVRARAGRRCECCRFHESDLPLFPFHIEHIIPKKHGGTDDANQLAWSCHGCGMSSLNQRNIAHGPHGRTPGNEVRNYHDIHGTGMTGAIWVL